MIGACTKKETVELGSVRNGGTSRPTLTFALLSCTTQHKARLSRNSLGCRCQQNAQMFFRTNHNEFSKA